jgi:hypothetical protein
MNYIYQIRILVALVHFLVMYEVFDAGDFIEKKRSVSLIELNMENQGAAFGDVLLAERVLRWFRDSHGKGQGMHMFLSVSPSFH